MRWQHHLGAMPPRMSPRLHDAKDVSRLTGISPVAWAAGSPEARHERRMWNDLEWEPARDA
jgi:hypothetical protein